MIRRTARRTTLVMLLFGLAALPAAAQWGENGEPPDPGFPENGFSYPARDGFSWHGSRVGELGWDRLMGHLDVAAWPPPTWLPHRGNRLYLHLAEKKRKPLQMFRVFDEQGRPLSGVTVEIQQAGYPVPGIRGETDAEGAFYVTLDKPARSHRVAFRASGRHEVVMEMSGGRLETARHEVVLAAGQTEQPPTLLAYVPEQRTGPPRDVLKAYRRGLRALSNERYGRAAIELRTAVERWPLPAGGAADGATLYRPYRALEQALEAMGEKELALTWERRAEVFEDSGS